MSQQQSSNLFTVSKMEFEQLQHENRKLSAQLQSSQGALNAATFELGHLRDGGSRTESQTSTTGEMLSSLIDELISTCKTVHVPPAAIRPKLVALDELYTDDLDEQIKIARQLLRDINHELVMVYGRKTSGGSGPAKISQVFTDV